MYNSYIGPAIGLRRHHFGQNTTEQKVMFAADIFYCNIRGGADGAWSPVMTSMVPSQSPPMIASRSAAESFIQEILEIPARLRIESIVALGYPAEKKTPLPRQKLGAPLRTPA